jgi:hypothetical protein
MRMIAIGPRPARPARVRGAARWVAGAACLSLALLLPAQLSGQQAEVRGTVVDGDSGAPVASARVTLVGTSGEVVHATLTDQSGRYNLFTRTPGWYTVRVSRLGYVAAQSDPVELGRRTRVFLDLTLEVSAIELEGVEARAALPAGYDGFDARRARGIGYFLDRAEVQEIPVRWSSAELLRDAPGFEVLMQANGQQLVMSRVGWRCAVVYVNEWPAAVWPASAAEPNPGMRTQAGDFIRARREAQERGPSRAREGSSSGIHNLVYKRDVSRVEAYAQYHEIPESLRYMVERMDTNIPCGLIIYWTHHSTRG